MSLQNELRAWEAQVKPKPPPKSLFSAVELREQGNDLFRLGKLHEAKLKYSESLSLEPTVESFTNRALVCIKLGLLLEAVSDCSQALEFDPKNVKALARRGNAKSGLRDHVGACKDYRLAEQLDPLNKLIQKEREREETLIQVSSSLVHQQYDEMELEIPQEEEEERKPIVNPVLLPKVLWSALESLPVSLPSQVPQSELQFTRLWRDLKEHPKLRQELVSSRMKPRDFATCFRTSVEPDLFWEILHSVSGSELLATIQALSLLPSFALAKMMLSKSQIDTLCASEPLIRSFLLT